MKTLPDQPAVAEPTRDVTNGERITATAKFRVFASRSEAFDEHGGLRATSRFYGNAMKYARDPNAFADALNGVYGTDPNYGFTLK